jgi:hypothetical protein
MSKLISFVELRKDNSTTLQNKKALVNEIIINSDHVIAMRPNYILKQKLLDLKTWPEDLDERLGITKIHMALGNSSSSSVINVLGSLEMILKKMESDNE